MSDVFWLPIDEFTNSAIGLKRDQIKRLSSEIRGRMAAIESGVEDVTETDKIMLHIIGQHKKSTGVDVLKDY